MMISRRPVSSPGRVEKYQPPFMGILRSKSNSRSRSRGRSRASPLFVRRNKSVATVTQEPSSPKVTCMGQVRVKRAKTKIDKIKPENPTRRRCKWFDWEKFSGKIKTMSFWSNWGLCSLHCSRKSKVDSPRTRLDRESVGEEEGKSFKIPKLDRPVSELVGEEERESFKIPKLDRPVTELVGEEEGESFKIPKLDRPVTELVGEEEGENFKIPNSIVSSTSPPPIDALLLTRSRSAPYRSSSLAFKFWEENNQREVESRNQREQIVRSGEKINGVYETTNIDETEVELPELGFLRRCMLTRSKSEPARIDEKILPDEKEG